VVITQNGDAKAVLQDVASYDELMESLTMLKLLALSRKSVRAGAMRPLNEAATAIVARTE
jgi:PHD/YefM family antitoxin component YafN of YafNO toxin-antitoxin module